MKKYKAINGHVIIRTKRLRNDRTESGLYKDVEFDKHAKMMIYAEAISVSETGTSHVVLQIEGGEPKSRESEPVYVRNNDYAHSIKAGDRVYFHYLTLEDPQNFIEMDGEYFIYKVPIHDVFLCVRPTTRNTGYIENGVNKEVVLQNQYVLGKEYWGEGWEEVEVDGQKIAGKVNSFGMVTETKDKPLDNYAIITDIHRGIDPYSRHKEVKRGDVVLLLPNCEFVNEIEFKERWIFTHTDIIGKDMGDGLIKPVSNYVLIKLKEREYKGNIHVDTDYLPLESEGWIEDYGASVDGSVLSKGTYVKFQSHGARSINDTHALVKDVNIMMILKHMI